MRPQGFYTVLVNGSWQIAEWNSGSFWTLCGDSAHYQDSDFTQIGTIVATPNPQLYPPIQTGIDFNAISWNLLALLATATWTDPNTGIPMQIVTSTRRMRGFANPSVGDFPWLGLVRHENETTVPAYALYKEELRFEAILYLWNDANLGSNYVPDSSLAAAEMALRSALYVALPLNGVPGGYEQLPPGTPQTLGNTVQEARVQGVTMRGATVDTSPMILVLPVVVVTGNCY